MGFFRGVPLKPAELDQSLDENLARLEERKLIKEQSNTDLAAEYFKLNAFGSCFTIQQDAVGGVDVEYGYSDGSGHRLLLRGGATGGRTVIVQADASYQQEVAELLIAGAIALARGEKKGG